MTTYLSSHGAVWPIDPNWLDYKGKDSNWAILQAGNLFVFGLNNPVFWQDPLGLFAWNEHPNHWFDLSIEVHNAGGTFRWICPSANIAEVLIFGVTVTFGLGQEGVRLRCSFPNANPQSAGIMVRADTFYSTVVNAATEMIFLGGHHAFGGLPAYHLHVSMFVSPNSYFFTHPDFIETGWGNVRLATISGTGEFGISRNILHAVSAINSSHYITRDNLLFKNHLHTGEGMVQQLFNAHEHFGRFHNRRFMYTPAGLLGRNSTSVTIGLLNAVGLDHGMTGRPRAVGIQSAIGSIFFGR